MKKLLVITIVLCGCLSRSFTQEKVPMVDSKGHIYYDKKPIGQLTKSGSMSMDDKMISKINANGTVVDSMGNVIGRLPKGQLFEYYLGDKPEKFSISKPNHNGICYVTDAHGKTMILLHNNYKQQAACAMHCAKENHCLMTGKANIEKKDTSNLSQNIDILHSILSDYFQLKDALTQDNSDLASKAGTELESLLRTFDKSKLSPDQKKAFEGFADELIENSEHIGKNSGKIEHQREHFEHLSNGMISILNVFGNGGQTLYKDYCPMFNKGAYWISNTKEIKNPYFGKKMQTCGSVKSIL